MSRPAAWLGELQSLAARFSDYGIVPDLAELTLAEAWGVFVFLHRIAEGA